MIITFLGIKIAEAEEALRRVEDKKKKDLENLKKQNERIAAIQVGINKFKFICILFEKCWSIT